MLPPLSHFMQMTFEELATHYAQLIETAAKNDKGLVKKGAVVTESVVAQSHLAAALKRIQDDLDDRVISKTKAKLTEEEKKSILGKTRLLLSGKPVNFVRIVKEASLEDFTSLVGEWDLFVSKL